MYDFLLFSHIIFMSLGIWTAYGGFVTSNGTTFFFHAIPTSRVDWNGNVFPILFLS